MEKDPSQHRLTYLKSGMLSSGILTLCFIGLALCAIPDHASAFVGEVICGSTYGTGPNNTSDHLCYIQTSQNQMFGGYSTQCSWPTNPPSGCMDDYNYFSDGQSPTHCDSTGACTDAPYSPTATFLYAPGLPVLHTNLTVQSYLNYLSYGYYQGGSTVFDFRCGTHCGDISLNTNIVLAYMCTPQWPYNGTECTDPIMYQATYPAPVAPPPPPSCTPSNICSGNNVVNSCTGALVRSCANGCSSGACNPPPSCTSSNICSGNDVVDSCTGAVINSCANGCSGGVCYPTGPCTTGFQCGPTTGTYGAQGQCIASPNPVYHAQTKDECGVVYNCSNVCSPSCDGERHAPTCSDTNECNQPTYGYQCASGCTAHISNATCIPTIPSEGPSGSPSPSGSPLVIVNQGTIATLTWVDIKPATNCSVTSDDPTFPPKAFHQPNLTQNVTIPTNPINASTLYTITCWVEGSHGPGPHISAHVRVVPNPQFREI